MFNQILQNTLDLRILANEGMWPYLGEKSFLLFLTTENKITWQHGLLAQVRVASLGFRTGIKTSRTLQSHMRNKVANFLHFCMQKECCTVTGTTWFMLVYASDFLVGWLVDFVSLFFML